MELNKIHCGNSLDLLKQLDDESVDMVMTSPPYDNLREYDGCTWNFEVFKSIADQLLRVVKLGGGYNLGSCRPDYKWQRIWNEF